MLDLSEPLDVASAIRWCESRLEGVTMPGARRGFAACLLALRAQQEAKSPCAACGYGGKYLDAPPCTECPAHPKRAEKNEPLTLKELRQMDGQPVYVVALTWYGQSEWAIVDLTKDSCAGLIFHYLFKGYGVLWLAYRRPPVKEAP